MRKRVIAAFIALFCAIAALDLPAAADGMGTAVSGKSRLTLQYKDNGTALADVTFDLYKVGTYGAGPNTNGSYDFTVTDAFQDAVVTLTGLKFQSGDNYSKEITGLVKTLVEYVNKTTDTDTPVRPSASNATSTDGEALFPNLEPGLYLVLGSEKRINATTVYVPQAFLIPLPYPTTAGGFSYKVTAKVKHETEPPEKIGLTVQKVWKDEKGEVIDLPNDASVTVQLYHNGEEYKKDGVGTQTLNEGNKWTYTWEDLEYDEYSTWTVEEIEGPDGYEVKMDWDEESWTWTITNTRTTGSNPVYDSITVAKIWKKGDSDPPKSVTVRLYCADTDCTEPSKEVQLNAGNNWSYTWEELEPDHKWTVVEDVPDGYEASYTQEDNVWTVTNTSKGGGGSTSDSITVRKVWADGNENHRNDSVTVQLLRNGEVFDERELKTGNNWIHIWTDLDSNYTWSVKEDPVPNGYMATVSPNGNEFTITNTPDGGGGPTYDRITVKKVWVGSNNRFPVKVKLLRDGEVFDEQELSAGNGWSKTWETTVAGHTWEVVEVTTLPDGWTSSSQWNGNTCTITNKFELSPDDPDGPSAPPNDPNDPNDPSGPSAPPNDPPDDPDEPGLPQTGQIWWPVPLLAAAGVLLLLIGAVLFARKEEPHE